MNARSLARRLRLRLRGDRAGLLGFDELVEQLDDLCDSAVVVQTRGGGAFHRSWGALRREKLLDVDGLVGYAIGGGGSILIARRWVVGALVRYSADDVSVEIHFAHDVQLEVGRVRRPGSSPGANQIGGDSGLAGGAG